MELKAIARIETDFPEKFGIPRQSGLVEELKGTIVFEPEYRKAEALKGLEGYNYIWLLWQFEGVERDNWSVTVRPPRLGGNKHMGVFATRSPFRPNSVGMSSVKLEKFEVDKTLGPVLYYFYESMKRIKALLDGVGSNGATMTNVNKTKFGSIKVLYPTVELLTKYNKLSKPIFKKILALSKEIIMAEQARDCLLPKLMNGEIEV